MFAKQFSRWSRPQQILQRAELHLRKRRSLYLDVFPRSRKLSPGTPIWHQEINCSKRIWGSVQGIKLIQKNISSFQLISSNSLSTASTTEDELKRKMQPIVPKKLNDVVKMELLDKEPTEGVRKIWTDYFALETTLGSTGVCLTKNEWNIVTSRVKQCPSFIFPVRKGDGAFFVLYAEWKDNNLIMTYLEDYKRSPHTAEAYFHLVPHEEYMYNKDIVLIQGEHLPYLTKQEASSLLNECLRFYLDDDKYKHVLTFNLESDKFDFQTAFNITI